MESATAPLASTCDCMPSACAAAICCGGAEVVLMRTTVLWTLPALVHAHMWPYCTPIGFMPLRHCSCYLWLHTLPAQGPRNATEQLAETRSHLHKDTHCPQHARGLSQSIQASSWIESSVRPQPPPSILSRIPGVVCD
jgi:hypothetical protein